MFSLIQSHVQQIIPQVISGAAISTNIGVGV